MISTSHLIFAVALAYALEKRIITAAVFSMVPDFDITFNFLYPFVHRGIMHSLLAAFFFSGAVFLYSEDRSSAESCLLGYCSALGLDLLTSSGLPLLFPLADSFSLGLVSAYSLEANLGIITASICIMFLKKHGDRLITLRAPL